MAITTQDLVTAAQQQITEIDDNEAEQNLEAFLILDVREPTEFDAGHLPEAYNIPRGVLEFQLTDNPALSQPGDLPILVYCQAGGRGALATETLQKLGYSGAVNLIGGYKHWLEQNRPVEK